MLIFFWFVFELVIVQKFKCTFLIAHFFLISEKLNCDTDVTWMRECKGKICILFSK